MYKREAWRGEVGDRGKGERRGWGLERWSEIFFHLRD